MRVINAVDTGKENTISRLAALLAPHCPIRYAIIFALELKDVIIPWQRWEDDIETKELIQLITEAVEKSFIPYQGSHAGYAAHIKERRLLYRVLFGEQTGVSLINHDFDGKHFVCTYDEKKEQFVLSYPETGDRIDYDYPQKIVCSKRQVKWCKEHVPENKGTGDKDKDIAIMHPAWQRIGDFNTSLPKETNMQEKELQFISDLFEQYHNHTNGSESL